MQVGSPEVVSGIARRALSVIHEAAQVTQTHSQTGALSGSEARAQSHQQGAGGTEGGAPFAYPQGVSQGIMRQNTKVHITLYVHGLVMHTSATDLSQHSGLHAASKYISYMVKGTMYRGTHVSSVSRVV